MSEATKQEPKADDKLSPDDQAVFDEGLTAFVDKDGLDDNPYEFDGGETVAQNEDIDRKDKLWSKGYLHGVHNEGRAAAKEGTPIDGCPYVDDGEDDEPSEYVESWEDGWNSWQTDLIAARAENEAAKPIVDFLNTLEAECERANREWQNAKEEASGCKKAYETAVLKLRAAVRESKKGGQPLFEQSQGEAKPETKPAPVASDAWRSVSINALNLPGSLPAKLQDADCETIGALEDLRGGKGLRSIKGIGQASVDKIEDAITDWLSKNRDAAVLQEAA